MRVLALWSAAVCFLGLGAVPLLAQDAAALFTVRCANCHEAQAESSAPARTLLRAMSPEQILSALERGAMQAQGSQLSRAQRITLAEFLAEEPLEADFLPSMPQSAFCADGTSSSESASPRPAWNGWGVTVRNVRFQPGDAAGITADEVPRLQLKWAFGFPGAASASAQPVVWEERVYVGSWEGDVFSLDAKTGCIYWTLQVEAGVRSAISIGQTSGGLTAYFGDLAANVYAVDAATGKQLWKVEVDDHPFARITGSPTLYEGRLYVPVSSREESQVRALGYRCCRFRGSVVALDAATGKELWKTYTIPEPRRVGTNRAGVETWGPSGASTWTSPTIDLTRRLIYVGTSNNYSPPSTPTSDAVIAFDMESGEIRWVRQFLAEDIWNGSCFTGDVDPATCPDPDAPDADVVGSPILVRSTEGRDILIATVKSAEVYALDPDQEGKVIWRQRVGKGGVSGGVMWGAATDGDDVYVAVADIEYLGRGEHNPNVGGGIFRLKVSTGEKLWNTPHPPCGERKPCSRAQSAAVTLIPGVVFSGSEDGHFRAYSTRDGTILWEYDTVVEYATVNGIEARGGSIDNGGPAVVDGMVFTNSGYSHHGGIIPGNVLLAFSVEGQ